MWVDGELTGVGHTMTTAPPGVRAFLDAPRAGKDFPGEIRNVRMWTKIPDEAELLPSAALEPIRRAAFAAEAKIVRGFDGKAPESGVLPVAIDRHARHKHVPFRTPPDARLLKELVLAAAEPDGSRVLPR